jgi:hypothetical protein
MADQVAGWEPVAAPAAGWSAAAPPASAPGWEPVPDFKSSNALDAEGYSVVDPNTLGTTLRHFWAGANPAQLGQLLPFPKALGGSGLDHPLNPKKVVDDMLAVKREADARWDAGDHVGAAAKYVESLVPLLGPMMSSWGNEAQGHKWAALLGDAGAFAFNLGLPEVAGAFGKSAGTVPRGTMGADSALSPAEAASNTFAAEHGIPLDAATATNSRFVRGVQRVSGESLLGAPVAERAAAAQQAGLTRVGGELAESAAPGAGGMTPEAGGQGIREAMSGLVRDLHKQAGGEYEKVRAAEGAPEHTDTIARTQSGAERQLVQAEQQRTLGRVPSAGELQELRRIQAELESLSYGSKTFVEQDRGAASGANAGHYQITAGHAGAPVYQDITSVMDSAPTHAELRSQIKSALETGNFRAEGAQRALEVAGHRLARSSDVSAPYLPPEAGNAVPRSQQMGLAVDLQPVQQAVTPLYEQLKREAGLVPLQGDKAKALVALDRVVNGPRHVPLSVADGALSDLKSMARAGDNGLRTVGQGKAAYAVKALEEAVTGRAQQAGPEVANALDMGRALTKEKYRVSDLLEQVRTEPVQAYRQLTAPKDSQIGLLRQVAETAPQQVQALGRAKLEEMLDLATERDRFDHVDRLYAEWNKLGPETKRILFGRELIPKLDDFFLLAKRIGQNPNPSGTAPTMIKAGEAVGLMTHPLATLPASLSMGALAKLMYTARGVQALTKVIDLDVKGPAGAAVKGAVRQAAWVDLATAARAAGVSMDLPKAAGSDPGNAK